MMQSLRIRLHNLYARYAGVTAPENALRDMLADMRHLADDLGFDFGRLDRAAYEIYSQEAAAAAQPAEYRNCGCHSRAEHEIEGCRPIERLPNCANCGHAADSHVLDEQHSHFGDCEQPMEGGFCRCPGYRSR